MNKLIISTLLAAILLTPAQAFDGKAIVRETVSLLISIPLAIIAMPFIAIGYAKAGRGIVEDTRHVILLEESNK